MEIALIVVPMYKASLTPEEKVSMRHLLHFLGEYDKCMIAPDNLHIDYPGFTIKRFNDSFFMDVPSYSRLLLSREFYETFTDYKYILIYQLDCLVFSDELMRWCTMDYDYVGGPWFVDKNDPYSGFKGVGNGGFSLRKIESFLKVIYSRRYIEEKVPLWQDLFFTRLNNVGKLNFCKRWLKKLRICIEVRKGVSRYMASYTVAEDRFWGERAQLFYPHFTIAPVEAALGFSFDWHPRYCFEKNNHKLPFGCHDWVRLGRDFWEPYLLK